MHTSRTDEAGIAVVLSDDRLVGRYHRYRRTVGGTEVGEGRGELGRRYAAADDGNSVRHSWTYTTGRGDKTRQHTVTLMFYPGDLAVMTRNHDDFAPAIKVLDGGAPSLAGAQSQLTGAAPPGASIYGEVVVPVGGEKAPPHMMLMRQVRHLTFALVHGDDDLALKVTAAASDPEVALQLQQIVEGFSAMMMLRHGGQREHLKDVVAAMRVKADGNTVRVNWPMTNEQVMHMIENRRGSKHERGDKHDAEHQD